MKHTYDPQADALYLQLSAAKIVRTQMINISTSLDFDENGDVVGIEILQVRKRGLDPYQITTEYLAPEHRQE